MKRYIALLLAIMMLLLTACNEAQPSADNADATADTTSIAANTDPDRTEPPTTAPTQETTICPETAPTPSAPATEPPTEPTVKPTEPTVPTTNPSTTPTTPPAPSITPGGSTSTTTPTTRPTESPAPTDAPAVEAPTTPTLKITTEQNTTISPGETLQIQYTYTGNKSDLTWTSHKESVLTVDNTGKVTALAEGNSVITVSDGTRRSHVNIRVRIPEPEPEYEKVTSLYSDTYNAPFYDGIVKYAGDKMEFRVTTKPYDSNPNIVVTSSDSNVISVSWSLNYFEQNNVTLNFKKAGSATITLTSADGEVSVSYKIQVKADYACNPGSGQLTPEQFVNCVNTVMQVNGAIIATDHGWRQLALAPSKLTWAVARSLGEGWIHEFWPKGITVLGLEYMGTDEDGNYVFRIHC